jgi:ubiquinone biosynthesis protein COQ4
MLASLAPVRAVVSFARVVKDPNRLEDVFEFANAVFKKERVAGVLARLHTMPECSRALEAQKRLPPIELDRLAAMPEGSLGHAFASHMRANGLDPAALPTYESHDEASWFRAHLYETHDIWHVVTGFATDVAGELGLQAFYAAQVRGGVPFVILASGLLNTAIYARADHERRLSAIAEGWRLGLTARPLFGVDWEPLWSEPLETVRARLGITPAGRAAA